MEKFWIFYCYFFDKKEFFGSRYQEILSMFVIEFDLFSALKLYVPFLRIVRFIYPSLVLCALVCFVNIGTEEQVCGIFILF